MTALKHAIKESGGPAKAAKVCGISSRAIYKWLASGHLPRTEYTGETDYARRLASAANGSFSAEWLLEQASPSKAA